MSQSVGDETHDEDESICAEYGDWYGARRQVTAVVLSEYFFLRLESGIDSNEASMRLI
jgi:hypothetical protein